MRKYYMQRTFVSWLKENRHNFKYQPIIFRQRWNYFLFKLHGITPKITVQVSKSGGFEVRVYHDNIFWDIIMDFDIHEKRSSIGEYYCDQCTPEHKRYYTSRQELFKEHTFKAFLDWINKHFTKENFLCLSGGLDKGFTAAKIVPGKKVLNMDKVENFACFLPVVL
ncbi:MAG: hypothetical protein ABIA04_15455 [Pseudomonadota bacterium]